MEELKEFAKLNLGDDDDGDVVVGHGQAAGRDIVVTIPSTETEYEEVCRRRWGDYQEAKIALQLRLSKPPQTQLLTWEAFYNLIEGITTKFAQAQKPGKSQVFEQCREFGTNQTTAKSGLKRAKDNVEALNIHLNYSIVSICANEQFAAVLYNASADPTLSLSGKLWICSTVNMEATSWRDMGVYIQEFQTGYVFGDVLYIVTSNSINVYKLPRAEQVYHLDVWEAHSVLLKNNVNVIRAIASLVVVVTRNRGFLVWRIVDSALLLLHYENPNTVEKSYQYTTASIYMDTIAFGTTDGYVEVWKALQPTTEAPASFVMLSRKHWFDPVVSSQTGKSIVPTPHQPIQCIEFCGPRVAISTEKDLVMVDDRPKVGVLCVLHDIATVASMKIFCDMICVLERDGGIMVSQFGSGRTFCNTIDSVSHVAESCVIGQQMAFFCGNMAGALMPDGALAVLNQDSMKKR